MLVLDHGSSPLPAHGGGHSSVAPCRLASGHTEPHVVSAGGCVVDATREITIDEGRRIERVRGRELERQREREAIRDQPDMPPLCDIGSYPDPCPQCGEGVLATKRGRFGGFVGCSRYPDCTYIRKDGPPPPDQLPFAVTCPKNGDGQLVARRARKTGNVFWGCSNYPRCDYTTSDEPLGGFHDMDDGAIARQGESAICLACGAIIESAPSAIVAGERYAGGPPRPEVIARPARAATRRA